MSGGRLCLSAAGTLRARKGSRGQMSAYQQETILHIYYIHYTATASPLLCFPLKVNEKGSQTPSHQEHGNVVIEFRRSKQ